MMYSYNAYKECVIDLLKQKFGTENVSEISITKNNGVKKEGVKLMVANHAASPVLYFEDGKEIYTGEDVDEFLKHAMEVYKDTEKYPALNIKVQEILSWEKIKHFLRVQLINYEKNKSLLEKHPYVQVLDLAVIFVLAFKDNQGINQGFARIKVNHELKDIWKLDVTDLLKQALSNMVEEPCIFKNLGELMREQGMAFEEDSPLYLLSVYDGIYGSAAMLNKNVLSDICGWLDCQELLIFPCSIHEILLVDKKGFANETASLKDMVADINRRAVDEQDYLSDSVYQYDNEKGVLQILGDDHDQNRLMDTRSLIERAG